MPLDGTNYPTRSEAARAIDIIERMEAFFKGGRRWCKGSFYQGDKACIVGALATACEVTIIENSDMGRLHYHTLRYLADAASPLVASMRPPAPSHLAKVLTQWNDLSAIRYCHVAQVLKTAKVAAGQSLEDQP